MHLSVGVTGHRDLLEQEKPALEARVRDFLQRLGARYPRLQLQLLSPLAEGGDQLAARVALAMGIDLVAVLPMAVAAYEMDFDSAENLRTFRNLLAGARQVIQMPTAPGAEEQDLLLAGPLRNRQYAQAGVFISNHCQVLLALWDGKPSTAVGGTAQIVRYHLHALTEGFDDQLSSAHLLADNENDLTHHIVCARDRLDGAPQPGLEALACYWLTAQHGRVQGDDLPQEYADMLDRLQEFESDRVRHATAQQASSGGLLNNPPAGLAVPASAKYIEQLFCNADTLAVHYQKRVNRSLYAIYALVLMMGLVFMVYSEYSVPPFVLWIFLGLFFTGIALHATGNRRQWHRKYLDYRALAEALRVQFYWNLADVVESRSVGFAYENFMQKQDVELGWIRHVMRAASMQRARGTHADDAWLPWVIEQWVGDRVGGGGQLGYYHHKELHNTALYRRTEFLGRTCLWSGVGVALILVAGGSRLSDSTQQFLLILMGLLPFIAGIRDAVSHKRAEKELIKQYRFMARIFANARRLLDTSETPALQRRVLKALGEAALEEGAEWILMHRARPLEQQGLN